MSYGECEYCSRAIAELRAKAGDAGVLFIPPALHFDPGRPDFADLVHQLYRRHFTQREVMLVMLLAANPWALHAAATLPGWRAFAESVRR